MTTQLKTLLDLAEEARSEQAKYLILDGRHRWAAATAKGIRRLRCDILTAAGGIGLRKIRLDELRVDPDVQFDFAYTDSLARRIAREWSPRKVGVLTVVPVNDVISLPERAQIKDGLDGVRRHRKPVEVFLTRVAAGDKRSARILKLAEDAGWEIGQTRGIKGEEKGVIEAVGTLEVIYGLDDGKTLAATLTLAGTWYGNPRCQHAHWLGGLSALVSEGYVDSLTDEEAARLRNLDPSAILRWVYREAENRLSGKSSPVVNALVCARVKRTAKLRRPRGWKA